MRNDQGGRGKYIPTDFDTIAYHSKILKPQYTNGLWIFVFCGWRFPHVERRKVRLCLPENEPSLGSEQGIIKRLEESLHYLKKIERIRMRSFWNSTILSMIHFLEMHAYSSSSLEKFGA